MANSTKDENILRHIVKHCEKIFALQERFGKDLAIFLADSAYYDAVFMNLLQIGELANHLSKNFQHKHKNIPWRQIVDLRNVIAHGYGSIKANLLWKTICSDVPELHSRVLEILGECATS